LPTLAREFHVPLFLHRRCALVLHDSRPRRVGADVAIELEGKARWFVSWQKSVNHSLLSIHRHDAAVIVDECQSNFLTPSPTKASCRGTVSPTVTPSN